MTRLTELLQMTKTLTELLRMEDGHEDDQVAKAPLEVTLLEAGYLGAWVSGGQGLWVLGLWRLGLGGLELWIGGSWNRGLLRLSSNRNWEKLQPSRNRDTGRPLHQQDTWSWSRPDRRRRNWRDVGLYHRCRNRRDICLERRHRSC
ncbi:hypothetical protein VZT92_024745 [Zoarces viviparus]|uniref:Uncharacterized protein n=1 Tax=Zoarces viviparus TaxID=48416 RepID=A0AAW1E3P9_ZOAVI